MEVLYYIRPYFGGISSYIALKNRPYIWEVPPSWVPGMAIELSISFSAMETSQTLTFISWLVVSNMFYFSIIYGIIVDNPSH